MPRYSCSTKSWKQYFSGHAVVPKKIAYHNWKLGLFLDVLRFLAISFIVVNASVYQVWYKLLVPSGYSGFWMELPENYGSLAEEERNTAPYCDRAFASRYDYKYSETWDYSNTSCLLLPRHLELNKFDDSAGMFIPTHWREKLTTVWRAKDVGSDGICDSECVAEENYTELRHYSEFVLSASLNRGDCLCKAIASKHYFALGVESKKIGFELAAELDFGDRVETLRQVDRNRNLLIILREAESLKEIRRVLPGEDLSVSISELLAMGGFTLEDRYENTHENMLGKGFEVYPVMRITGMEMQLSFGFHNPADANHLEGLSHQGPVCYVEVRINPKWSSMTKVAEDPGDLSSTYRSARERYMYGITIEIKLTGSFSQFDPEGIISAFADAFVYMQLPTLIVVFVAQYLLGPLSIVYRKAQIQSFSTVEALHGFCSRIMVAKNTYSLMLENQQQVLPETEELTEANFRSQMYAIIEADQRGEELSEVEIAAMIDVAVTSINNNDDQVVSFGDYLTSHSNSECVTLHEIACLFDFDRKRGILERCFEPDFFKNAKARVRASQESNSEFFDACIGKSYELQKQSSSHTLTDHSRPTTPQGGESPLSKSGMATHLKISMGEGDEMTAQATPVIDDSQNANNSSAESKTIAAAESVAAETVPVEELRKEVSRLKYSHEETIEKFNVAFDRMVAQIDQIVASRLQHLGDRLGAAFEEFQGQARSQLKPVNGVANDMDEVVSRMELMGYRLGSVVTEFQGVAASSKVPINGFGNRGATSLNQSSPLGDTEKAISALQLAQKGQNHLHGILEARVFDLHQRVERRFGSVEHVFNTVFGRLEGDFAKLRASAAQQPRDTPKLDIGQLSDRIGGLVSDMNLVTESEERRNRDLPQEGGLSERFKGTVAVKSDAHASQVPELSERLMKLEHELRKLEDVVWQVRDDVASFDFVSIQAQAAGAPQQADV